MLEWPSMRGKPDVKEMNDFSSDGAPEQKPQGTSGISLALGGGAARGWAYMGCCAHSTRPASKSA